MSLDGKGVSAAARQKIGRFSIVSWVYALAAMLVVTVVTTSMVRIDLDNGGIYVLQNNDARYSPDSVENIAEAVYDPETGILEGTGAAVFHIENTVLGGAPFQLSYVAGRDSVGIYQTPGGTPQSDYRADMRLRADYRGIVSEYGGGTLVFPATGTTEIWIGATGAWRMKLSTLEAEEIVTSATGSGNKWLVYRGDSLSGRAAQLGDGLFGVWVYSEKKSLDLLVNERGSSENRISWASSDPVYFYIESDAARASWELRIDTLATEEPNPPASEPPASGETDDDTSPTPSPSND